MYLSEYMENVAEYAKTVPESESVKAVKYFKQLINKEIQIIKVETVFVVDYSTSASDLLVKVEGSKYPMSHVLYSKVREVRKVHSIVMNAKDVKSVLFAKTKAILDTVSDEQQKRLLKRIQSVVTACDKLLKGFMNEDTAKDFFESAKSLFDPCKMMSCSTESVSKSKKELFLLDSIPFPNFSVLHSVLVDIVKENTKTAKTKKIRYVEEVEVDLVVNLCGVAIERPGLESQRRVRECGIFFSQKF